MKLFFIIDTKSNVVDYVAVSEKMETLMSTEDFKNKVTEAHEVREICTVQEDELFPTRPYFRQIYHDVILANEIIEPEIHNSSSAGIRQNNGVEYYEPDEKGGILEDVLENSEYLWEVDDPDVLEEFQEYLSDDSVVYCDAPTATTMDTCFCFV